MDSSSISLGSELVGPRPIPRNWKEFFQYGFIIVTAVIFKGVYLCGDFRDLKNKFTDNLELLENGEKINWWAVLFFAVYLSVPILHILTFSCLYFVVNKILGTCIIEAEEASSVDLEADLGWELNAIPEEEIEVEIDDIPQGAFPDIQVELQVSGMRPGDVRAIDIEVVHTWELSERENRESSTIDIEAELEGEQNETEPGEVIQLDTDENNETLQETDVSVENAKE